LQRLVVKFATNRQYVCNDLSLNSQRLDIETALLSGYFLLIELVSLNSYHQF